MRPDPRILLADIQEAGADIEHYLEAMTLENYLKDGRTQAAVERKFEIIGEALNRLHGNHPELARRIPQLRRIVDFRNLLSHGYDRVLPDRVWSYAEGNLPELRQIVQTLLTELGPPEDGSPSPR